MHHIFAGGQAVALYKSRSDSTQELIYLHRDHLGSVTEITDQWGTVVEALSYDALGKRRDPDWTDSSSVIVYGEETARGFTGHEHLDDAALVHMGGRVYDPVVGRMLSPDPLVQFPSHSQSFNRYSYVLNNPLAFTDPSGYCIAAGASCPMGGLGGFTGGLAGTMGSARPPLSGFSTSMIITRGFSFSFGGLGLGNLSGGGTCIVAGCSPYPGAIHFDDVGAPNIGFFHNVAGIFTTQVHRVYSFSAPILHPNNQEDGRHTPNVYLERYAGATVSMALLGGGRQSGPVVSNRPTPLTPRGSWRPLTAGEIAMLEPIFFDDIDYSRTRIYNRKFQPFQAVDLAMAPNGYVYFHPDAFRDDFSTAGRETQGWFVHEMTHVWQHQQGVNVGLRGIRPRQREYRYLPLDTSKKLEQYTIEQQGDIVRDYFYLTSPNNFTPTPGSATIAEYLMVLPFKKGPN